MNLDPQDLVSDAMDFPTEVCNKCGSFIVITPAGPECDCSRAALLAQAKAAKVAEKVPEAPPAAQQPQPAPTPKEALTSLPGAPTEEQIALWKTQCKAVYLFPLDNKEIYVWRPLIYREWQQLKSNEELVKNETKFQEHVVMRAVLWPKLDVLTINASRAGLVQTLFSLIMQGSYFLAPELAINLVTEL